MDAFKRIILLSTTAILPRSFGNLFNVASTPDESRLNKSPLSNPKFSKHAGNFVSGQISASETGQSTRPVPSYPHKNLFPRLYKPLSFPVWPSRNSLFKATPNSTIIPQKSFSGMFSTTITPRDAFSRVNTSVSTCSFSGMIQSRLVSQRSASTTIGTTPHPITLGAAINTAAQTSSMTTFPFIKTGTNSDINRSPLTKWTSVGFDIRSVMVKTLGSGAQATVELRRDCITQRKFAVKIMYPPTGREDRFLEHREAEEYILCSLRSNQHKNVILHFSTFYFQDNCAVAQTMEQVVGWSMEKRHRAFNENALKNFLFQALTGLDHIHTLGIIHRDIKTANFMLSLDGIVKIIDFGVAIRADTHEYLRRGFVGSPAYMAPEIKDKGDACTTAVDVFSLGATAVDLMSEVTVGLASTNQILAISSSLQELVMVMVNSNPLGRPSAKRLSSFPCLQCPIDPEELLDMYPAILF